MSKKTEKTEVEAFVTARCGAFDMRCKVANNASYRVGSAAIQKNIAEYTRHFIDTTSRTDAAVVAAHIELMIQKHGATVLSPCAII